MEKKIIAFDCDGVLSDTARQMVLWHNENYGTRHKVEDIKTYFISELWRCSREEEFRKFEEFYKSSYFSAVPVVDGAVEGIRTITNHNPYTVALTLTARPENIHDVTRKWFRRNFPGKFNGIYFSKPHGVDDNSYLDKPEWCKKLEVGIIVEDSAENAIRCYESGIRAIVFNQPWNVDIELPNGIERAKNWEELTELLI